MPFAAPWMDPEIVTLSEVSKTEKKKYHMASFICAIKKEMIQMNLLTKQLCEKLHAARPLHCVRGSIPVSTFPLAAPHGVPGSNTF